MPPEITGHQAGQVVTAGETASFQVTASSQYPLSYRAERFVK
jgi:hypothetical protein